MTKARDLANVRYTKGTTANRPSPAIVGQLYYDTDLGQLLNYTVLNTWVAVGTAAPEAIIAEFLVIAGGGGTATVASGGAGAGGLLYDSNRTLPKNVVYTLTVGSGGTGAGLSERSGGTNGVNSSVSGSGFTTITALGGGFGIGFPSPDAPATGGSGGSGGGSSGTGGGTAGTGTAGPPCQGYNGGTGNPTSGEGGGGGGGGAGAAGATAVYRVPGNGGAGVSTYSSWGAATSSGQNVSGTYWFAGGGGGGGYTSNNSVSTGGDGGGGAGTSNTGGSSGVNGTANTGGGGGGTGGFTTAYGANGGSGIIIIKYPETQPDITTIAAGLTYTRYQTGGFKYYKFTAGTGSVTI